MIGTTDAGVQIVPIGSGDAYGHRTDAHDPEGPVADEGEFASGAGVLFASGIKQSRVHNPISATSEICDTTRHRARGALAAALQTQPARPSGDVPDTRHRVQS